MKRLLHSCQINTFDCIAPALKTILMVCFFLVGIGMQSQTLTSVAVSAASATTTYGTGGTITYTITVTRSDNGSGSAALSISTLPTGVTAVFSPTTVSYSGSTATATSTLTLTTTATAAAITSSPFTVTATASNSVFNNTRTFTINRAALTITANNGSKTYGSTQSTPVSGATAFSSTGLRNSETIGSVTLTYGAGALTATATVGSTSTITPSAAIGGTFTASNYTISYTSNSETLSVTAAPLTITANTATHVYGATLTPGSGATPLSVTGMQNSETLAGTVTLAYTSGNTASSAIGSYSGAVSPSAFIQTSGTAMLSNYTINYVTNNLSVTTATLTVTANTATHVYGATLTPGSGATPLSVTGMQNSETLAGTVTLAYTSGNTASSAVGTYTGAVSPSTFIKTSGSATLSNYTITYVTNNLSVTVAALTITANNGSKNYGQTFATGTGSTLFSSSGLQNSETIGNITIASSGAVNTAIVGSYAIVPSAATAGTFTASNYNITYTNGTLTVNTTPLTITANNGSKTYGQTFTTGTGSTLFSSSGLQNSETIGNITIASSGAVSTASVGGYSIVPSAATAGTFTASNYNITYTNGTLTVNTAPLTITANNGSKTYGQTFTTGSGSILFTSSGLQNSDTIGSITIASSGAVNTAIVGSYAIVPSAATVGTFTASNYNITYTNGTLTVNTAPLTITANNGSKAYGQTFTTGSGSILFTSSGLQNSDTIGSITIASSGAVNTAIVGSYAIVSSAATAGTFTASNYNITYTNGTLTVNTANLTITGINADNKTYDGLTAATLSGTSAYVGLQNSETFAVIGPPSASFATATVGTGKAVTVTGYTIPSSNYTLTQPSLTANITTANLTITGITANNKTFDGLTTATLSGTAAYVGLQNSETFAVTGTPSASFTTAAAGIAKPVTVIGYTAPNTNYTVSQPTGLTADIIAADPTSASASISSICIGATTILSLNGGGGETGALVKWYTDSCGATVEGTGNGLSVSPTVTTTYFGRYEGIQYTTNCALVTITVSPTSTLGAVSADQTICNGSSPSSNITIASATGTIQWQRADNAGFTTNLTNIGSNSTTLTTAQVGPLTATRYFRAIVTSGVCSAVTSGTVTVTVDPTSAVGAVSANQTICSGGSPSSNITIASATGTIQWQRADDSGFTTNLTSIGTNSTSLTIAEIGVLTATKYFRAVVTSGVCSAVTSGTVTVTVNAVPAGPVIAKNPNTTEVCAGQTVTITVTTAGTGGAVSSQDEYRFSTNNGSSWSLWSTTIPNFTAVTGTNTIESRRTSTGSGCTTASGNTVSWTVNAVPVGPVIAKSPNATAVCAGQTVTITVTTAGTGGAISSQDEYRFSTDNGTIWSSWGTSLPNFTAVAGTNIIESRRTSTGAGCTTAAGNTVSWTVNAVPVGPIIAKNPNATEVCSGTILTITSTAGTGGAISSQDEYRFSTDNGSNWSSWSSSIPNFVAVIGTNIVESRRFSTGSGCTTAAGNSVSWTVNAVPVGPVITKSPNAAEVCVGQPLTIAITTAGTGGAISAQDEYRFSTNNGSNWSSWSTTIPNFTAVTGTNIIESRRTSTGIGCTTTNGNTVSWTVNPLPVAPIIAKNPNLTSVCIGASLTISITTAGTGGAISSQDEYRYNAGSGYTAWSTTIPNFSAGIGTNIIESRRTSTGSGCTTSSTNTVSWTVNPDPSPGSLTKSPNTIAVCDGTVVSATATAGSGGAGTIVDELEVSLSGGAFSTYTSGASINTTGQTFVNIRTRRTATANGCSTSSYNTVSWTVNPLPTANAGFDSTIFRGNPTTTPLGATAVGLNTYSWVSNPIGFTSSISNPTVSPLVNTTYTLTETTPEGCIKSNSVTVTVRDNLVVSKSRIGAAPTKPGDVVTYQIIYNNLNNGGVSAENITITDILPSTAYFTYTSSTPTGTYNAGTNSLTYTLASLAAGASGSITVSGIVGVLGGYGYNSSSYYISSGSSTQTITNSASIVNPVTPALVSNVSDNVTQNCGVNMPATLVGKVHTATASNLYYFIEVENTGNSTDRFSLINYEIIPIGKVPLTSLITNMAGDPISQTPWLSPGQKYGFLVQFSTPGGTPPDKYNDTYIMATSTVCPSTSDTTYIDTYVYNGPQPTGCDLLISKSASASTVVAGANITYTLLVRNLSNNKANDLVIDDILPANLTYISATQTGANNINYNPTTRLIRVTRAGNYDNSDPDIVITITAQTTCASVPSVINSATVVNTVEDDNILNNESNVTVTVLPNVSDPVPTSAIICSGNSTTITMPAPGSNRNYKWYSAATGGTLLQTNGNTYNTGSLTSTTTFYVSQYNTLDSACESNRTPITITVVSAPVVISQPADITVCSTTASFTYNVSGTFLNQQWQVSTDGGTNWNNLSNSGVYSGTTTQTLNISNLAGLWGYKYRCNLNSFSCYTLTSTVATIVSLPTITGTLSVCSGSTITLTGSGIPDPTTPWASSNPAVATVNNSGVVTGVSAGTTVITYKSSNNCSITATVTVNGLPNNISNGFSATTICFGGTPLLTFDAENSSFSSPYSVTYRNDITLTQYTATIPNASAYNFTAGDNPSSNAGYTILSISNAYCTRTSGFTDSGANLTVRPLPVSTISGTTSVCAGTPSPFIVFTNPQTVDITVTYTINGVSQTINVGNNSSSSVAASTTVSGSFVYNLVSVAYQSNPNCSNTISGSATVIINPLPLSPSLVTTQPNCALQTGTITINSVAGETYSFNGGSYSGTLVYSGLAQGSNHTVFSMNAFGCISTASSSATIIPLITNTWTTGGWSTGIPDLNTLVIIDANYNTSTHGDLNACSVTVNLGKTLTITANDYAIIQNNLTVNGIVDVLDKGSLVMVNDAGIVTNNGTTTVRRFTSPFEKFDYVYWSTPVTSTNIPSTFLNWRTNYSFEFLPANFIDLSPADSFDDDGNDWSYASTMSPGKGYIVMVPNPTIGPGGNKSEVIFSGKVNNGVITTPIALTPSTFDPGDDFNLVGNPYPSAISADAFIKANINSSINTSNNKIIGGTLYFWTHIGDISSANGGPDGLNFSTNDYAVYTLAGGVGTSGNILGGSPDNSNKPNGYIASGQGFFVEADIAGTLLFNNAMRVGTETKNNQFYKVQSNKNKVATVAKDRLWLNLQNASNLFSQQLIGYFDNATLGYDKGYDGLFSDAGNYINFYSFIDNDTYKIQGRSSFNENDQVRLGYSSKIAGTFTISIDSKEGVFANTNQAVYLEDKVTNSIFNLKNGSYSFSTAKGTFNDRFVLRYTNDKTLSLDEINTNEDGILVFYSKNYNTLIIKNNFDSIVNSVALFNINGQNITKWDVKYGGETTIQFPIKNIPSGVYIVKVKTSKGEISNKIMIK